MTYPLQEPSYKCLTKEAVRALFLAPSFERELYNKDGNQKFANTTRLLGNPLVEGFEAANIVDVRVVGFGPDKSRTALVRVHRKLAPLIQTAFEKIKAARLPYVLHEVGGHFFRYMLNDDVHAALKGRGEYVGVGGAWNIEYAKRDLKNQAFDELVPYGKGHTAKKNLLSNHAYGSAIDLNWGTNDYNKNKPFDMPQKIVRIFESLGFYWGGYYHDYMHFEYERSSIVGISDESPPLVLYPFGADAQRRESPLKYYFFNEGGAGGYFPLGRQQNIHAGVHMEPDSREELVPVKAAMPGYIVAARLLTPGKEGDDPFLLEATEGRPLGFVLIKHELSAVQDGQPSAETHPLYSLYMHLAPPEWGGGADKDAEFQKAPWLASFLQLQHGAVVNLDPTTEDAGKTFWSQVPIDPEAESFRVKDRAELLKGKKNGQTLALTKPSPEDVRKAIESLKKGSIITFDRPLFPVAAGEIIGFVSKGRAVPQSPGATASRTAPPPPRYLHWELFSLSGNDGGLLFLVQQDPALKDLLREVKEQRQDNFLQMPSDDQPSAENEVNTILGSTGVEVVEALKRARYGKTLQEYFNDGTKFFSADATREKPFTWPLPLTLDNKHKFAGTPGRQCTLEVLYKKAGQPLSKEVIPLNPKNQATLNVTLNVPADADALALWSADFFSDPVEVAPEVLRNKRLESRTKLFQKAAGHRWRNLVLDHLNEWTPKGLGEQLSARDEAKLFEHLKEDPDFSVERLKKQLLPLCWWARPATREDPFGEVPVLGAEQKSLFGADAGRLPEDASIVNMHPVTALWLVDLLLEKERIALRKEWPPATLKRDESNDKPLYLGVLTKQATALAGMEAMAVLVQHGYGSTEGTNGAQVTFWLAPKGDGAAGPHRVLCRAPYDEGVARARIRVPSWGQWEVYATGADEKRFVPEQTHATAFDVPRPVLTGQPFVLGTKEVKAASKQGPFRPLATGSFVVSDHWPAELPGYVVFEYWKVPPRGQPPADVPPIPGTLAVPAVALRPPEETTVGGLKYKNGYVVGVEKKGTNPKVTPNFSFNEFVKHPTYGRVFEGELVDFQLSVPLALRLQQLRDKCKPATTGAKDLSLTVIRVAPLGNSLLVGPSLGTAAALDTLMQKVALLPPSDPPELFTITRDDDEVAVRITYHPPTKATGVLLLEFDPAPALGRMAAEALNGETAGETLHVRPRFIASNTGHSPHLSGALPSVEGALDLFTATATQIQAACGNDFLEVVADKCLPPVARFELGDIQFKMGGNKLRTEVPLYGDANQWKAGEPLFKLAGASQSKRVGTMLQADWPLVDAKGERIPAMWAGPLKFTAEVSQPGKVLTPPPPVTLEVTVKPRLESLTHEVRASELALLGKGHFIPTDADFRIVCEKLDATTGQWADDTIVNSALRYTTPGAPAYGRCTELGVFEATVPKKALKKSGGPFRFTWRRRPDKTGAPRPVLGVVLDEPSTPQVTVEELGL
ncbi:M15 family metallopeptidase [Pyxidicoccus parkwayensis]|uniref:M15 family metallopeptidase n=1 Tax=Pyxidicoccus parkwayensis TaxID=2813578 RepID=A0ABX7P9X0_9BACT|nr:M15 family metallopeptidase [Pyxidicoccus parkwaysis]QSQ27254.1 M15 family metallopeptidase [Pyxidicoccus parkwaysis]